MNYANFLFFIFNFQLFFVTLRAFLQKAPIQMFKNYSFKTGIRFRRFCHKAYAAFRSLHREVTIGHVAGYMTDLEMLKHGKSVAVTLCGLFCIPTMAENSSGTADSIPLTDRQLSLQEVLVVSQKAEVHSEAFRLITQVSHAEIEALPIQTVADILQYLPGLDVRTRGANGAQADISMRGGTFDQVLVLLNGVSMSDFHTGHYALNLPITPAMIERIEVLQGTSAHLHGAFSGAINIVTKQTVSNSEAQTTSNRSTTSQTILRLDGGMNGWFHPQVAASVAHKEAQFNIAADYSRAEGYLAPQPTEKEAIACRNSDFQLVNLYFQTRWRELDVQAGAQWKDAGLGMGYGFGSQDQFDATRTAFASATVIFTSRRPLPPRWLPIMLRVWEPHPSESVSVMKTCTLRTLVTPSIQTDKYRM